MDDKQISKTDIENDFVKIFEKYPKSLEKSIYIGFVLILECFIVILGEKKDDKSIGTSKKGGKDEKLQSNSGQTSKNTQKDIKNTQKQYKNNGFLNLKKSQIIPVNKPESS